MDDPSTQQHDNSTRQPRDAQAGLTQEQVRNIAERVYAMLLRDLRQERERNRSMLWNAKMLKRGR